MTLRLFLVFLIPRSWVFMGFLGQYHNTKPTLISRIDINMEGWRKEHPLRAPEHESKLNQSPVKEHATIRLSYKAPRRNTPERGDTSEGLSVRCVKTAYTDLPTTPSVTRCVGNMYPLPGLSIKQVPRRHSLVFPHERSVTLLSGWV